MRVDVECREVCQTPCVPLVGPEIPTCGSIAEYAVRTTLLYDECQEQREACWACIEAIQ